MLIRFLKSHGSYSPEMGVVAHPHLGVAQTLIARGIAVLAEQDGSKSTAREEVIPAVIAKPANKPKADKKLKGNRS